MHHIETSQSICRADQLTGFYMTGTLDVNGLTDINNFHMNSVLYFLMLLKNTDEKFDAKAFFLFSGGFPFKKNSSFLNTAAEGRIRGVCLENYWQSLWQRHNLYYSHSWKFMKFFSTRQLDIIYQFLLITVILFNTMQKFTKWFLKIFLTFSGVIEKSKSCRITCKKSAAKKSL